MGQSLKTVVAAIVITAVVAAGGVVGTVYVVDLSKQPNIYVRGVNAGIVDCRPGDYRIPIDNQYVFVASFRLANTGEVPGYIEISIAVDGAIVRSYTFLVGPDENRTFYPSDDSSHDYSPSDNFIYLQGCSASAVSYIVGNVWRA